MAHSSWKASSFLAKTSAKPIQAAVLGIVSFVVLGLVAASHFEVDYRVVVYGEVISKSGEREVISPNDGIVELKPLTIGQNIAENEIIGYIKIPFSDHQKVSELLVKMHQMFETVSKAKAITKLIWPELDSENALISEQLLKAKDALEEYNNEIQSKIKLIDLKTKNLTENKKKLQRRVEILSNSKNRSLTESLIEEQKKEIGSINEELAKIENDQFIKASEIRSQLLATLKNSYLKVYQFKDSHVVKSYSSGKISKILTAKYQQVKKDQSVLVLSPADEEFEFKLKIPTYDAGKISANLSLRGEIDSFPYQKFGMFTGMVLRVDQALTRSDLQSYYNAYTTIQNPQNLSRSLASSIQLLPGMKVKAHIVLKKVTLTQLVYEKLFLPNEDL
jgi:membrane fusion protein